MKGRLDWLVANKMFIETRSTREGWPFCTENQVTYNLKSNKRIEFWLTESHHRKLTRSIRIVFMFSNLVYAPDMLAVCDQEEETRINTKCVLLDNLFMRFKLTFNWEYDSSSSASEGVCCVSSITACSMTMMMLLERELFMSMNFHILIVCSFVHIFS